MKVRLLVIGYGNEMRGDDGVGPAVARAVQSWGHPRIRAIAVHQLTPELAEAIAGAERVVFFDARLGAEGFSVERVVPVAGPSLDHTSAPGWLLGLAEELFEHTPPAWLATIPAANLDFGSRFSVEAARGRSAALRWIATWSESGPRAS